MARVTRNIKAPPRPDSLTHSATLANKDNYQITQLACQPKIQGNG